MQEQQNYGDIKSMLDLVSKSIPKDKGQTKSILITSIAGLVGVALIYFINYLFTEMKLSDAG